MIASIVAFLGVRGFALIGVLLALGGVYLEYSHLTHKIATLETQVAEDAKTILLRDAAISLQNESLVKAKADADKINADAAKAASQAKTDLAAAIARTKIVHIKDPTPQDCHAAVQFTAKKAKDTLQGWNQ